MTHNNNNNKASKKDEALLLAVTAKLDKLEQTLSGFDETRNTVVRLAKDVAYLVAHSDNVTKCAGVGHLHLGNGNCFDPVPNCDKPSDPDGGTILSSIPPAFFLVEDPEGGGGAAPSPRWSGSKPLGTYLFYIIADM